RGLGTSTHRESSDECDEDCEHDGLLPLHSDPGPEWPEWIHVDPPPITSIGTLRWLVFEMASSPAWPKTRSPAQGTEIHIEPYRYNLRLWSSRRASGRSLHSHGGARSQRLRGSCASVSQPSPSTSLELSERRGQNSSC